MNGRQVISFNVQRSKGSSEVTTYDKAWEELRKLEKEDPRIHFTEIVNQVDYTKAQYHSAIDGLWEGAVLAVLVVFLFLRDIRATLISALAIPLSAIPAFWFMSLMGITLNGLSLLALSLVAGVLVDDAIVEIENIVRHMRMGKSGYQASIDAADEIGLAVLATTMAIVAVFLPVALMPGISGQFFKAFGFTVVIAVMMSLLVARMITPMLAAFFLRSKGIQPHASGWAMEKYLDLLKWSLSTERANALRATAPDAHSRFYYYGIAAILTLLACDHFHRRRGSDVATRPCRIIGTSLVVLPLALIAGTALIYGAARLMGWGLRKFGGNYADWHAARVVPWIHDHRIYMVGVGGLMFAIQAILFANLSMTFQPPLNLDFSRVQVSMAPGSTLKQTEVTVDRAAEIIKRDPDVDRVFERVFVGSGYLNIVLKKDRAKTSTEFERGLSPALAGIADARVNFLSQNGGGPGGGRDIMLYLGSDNPVILAETANKIADEMATLPGLRAPRVAGDLVRPEIVIKPRFDLAADLGVTTTALSQTIRIATLGDIEQNSAKFSLADRQVPITVALSENSRRDLADAREPSGSDFERRLRPAQVGGGYRLRRRSDDRPAHQPDPPHRGRRGPRPGPSHRRRLAADQRTADDEEPPARRIQTEPRRSEVAGGADVLLRYCARLGRPARVRGAGASLPALPGSVREHGLAAHRTSRGPPSRFIVTGNPLSLPVLIGILMLFGIVAKNSILLVDFAIEMMNHGMPKDEAIYEAGHKRAQPIVMTTVAMVAGMLPIALSLAGDAQLARADGHHRDRRPDLLDRC